MTSTQTGPTNIAQALKEFAEQMLANEAQPQADVKPEFQVTAEFVELPKAEADKLLEAYHNAEILHAASKATLDAAKQAIIDRMAKAEVLVIEETGQEIVTHRVVEAMITDTTALKKDHPQLAAQYQKVRVSRPLKVLV